MKKVLIISNIPSPYQVDLFYYLYESLVGYDMHALYTSPNESNRQWNYSVDKLKNTTILNSKIIEINTEYDKRFFHIPRGINRALTKINPDVIISAEYGIVSLYSILWCKFNKRKYICLTEGTLNSEKNINVAQKWLRFLLARYSNAFVAASTKAKEKLCRYRAEQKKIFMGLLTVNINNYLTITRKAEHGRILYVGSMVERKGLDLLIKALPNLKSEYELVIVGNGTTEQKEKLVKLAQEEKVHENIEWVGFRDGAELLSEYSRADVFVLPTREDCFGLVLLEAVAARVPVVSSKYADGAYDIIEDGKNGFIVDPYNAVELAEAIDSVFDSYFINRDLESFDREVVKKFEFSNVAKGYVDAIRFVIGENKNE